MFFMNYSELFGKNNKMTGLHVILRLVTLYSSTRLICLWTYYTSLNVSAFKNAESQDTFAGFKNTV